MGKLALKDVTVSGRQLVWEDGDVVVSAGELLSTLTRLEQTEHQVEQIESKEIADYLTKEGIVVKDDESYRLAEGQHDRLVKLGNQVGKLIEDQIEQSIGDGTDTNLVPTILLMPFPLPKKQ